MSAVGLYTCVASNILADGESNAALLDIKFPPTCSKVGGIDFKQTNDILQVGRRVLWMSIGNTREINCMVKSNPFPNKFTWKFKSRADIQVIRK